MAHYQGWVKSTPWSISTAPLPPISSKPTIHPSNSSLFQLYSFPSHMNRTHSMFCLWDGRIVKMVSPLRHPCPTSRSHFTPLPILFTSVTCTVVETEEEVWGGGILGTRGPNHCLLPKCFSPFLGVGWLKSIPIFIPQHLLF